MRTTPIGRLVPFGAHRRFRHAKSWLLNELPYLETHVVDHCTLSCKGCSHFSSIAPQRFADPDRYCRDIVRLAEVFRRIPIIRLMGGEPLLHPDLHEFVRHTRAAFPGSHVAVVTNGTHLDRASEAFWDSLLETGAQVDLTLYPPMAAKAQELTALCARRGAVCNMTRVDSFNAYNNIAGDSDPAYAFAKCGLGYYCRFLRDGRLYPCAMAAMAGDFNDRFGYTMAIDEGIDIHARGVTARSILHDLGRPMESCRWCATIATERPWASGECQPEDWDASSRRRV